MAAFLRAAIMSTAAFTHVLSMPTRPLSRTTCSAADNVTAVPQLRMTVRANPPDAAHRSANTSGIGRLAASDSTDRSIQLQLVAKGLCLIQGSRRDGDERAALGTNDGPRILLRNRGTAHDSNAQRERGGIDRECCQRGIESSHLELAERRDFGAGDPNGCGLTLLLLSTRNECGFCTPQAKKQQAC